MLKPRNDDNFDIMCADREVDVEAKTELRRMVAMILVLGKEKVNGEVRPLLMVCLRKTHDNLINFA